MILYLPLLDQSLSELCSLDIWRISQPEQTSLRGVPEWRGDHSWLTCLGYTSYSIRQASGWLFYALTAWCCTREWTHVTLSLPPHSCHVAIISSFLCPSFLYRRTPQLVNRSGERETDVHEISHCRPVTCSYMYIVQTLKEYFSCLWWINVIKLQ